MKANEKRSKAKEVLKELTTNLKELINDIKATIIDEGIFPALFQVLILICLCILLLPFLPFFMLNEWSKEWFEN